MADLDQTLAVALKGYAWLPDLRRRAMDDPGADGAVLRTRVMGEPAVAVCGPSGTQFFYGAGNLERHTALPGPVVWTLFGRGAVHTLDDEAHRVRKALFTSLLLDRDGIDELARLTGAAFDDAAAPVLPVRAVPRRAGDPGPVLPRRADPGRHAGAARCVRPAPRCGHLRRSLYVPARAVPRPRDRPLRSDPAGWRRSADRAPLPGREDDDRAARDAGAAAGPAGLLPAAAEHRHRHHPDPGDPPGPASR